MSQVSAYRTPAYPDRTAGGQNDANTDEAPFDDSRHYVTLAAVVLAVAATALVFYLRQNAILLYGDAVAHINIARRVFDSRTPGIFQLGTVWLPLPHVLDMPFIVNDRLWQTGVGGSITSMLAYVAGCLGIFRLIRGMASRLTAWTATLVYALNPNLIYMQATAMTETLYLALFIWTAVFFSEFVQATGRDHVVVTKPGELRARKSLERCAMALSAAILVRYDAWFLAVFVGAAVLYVWWRNQIPHHGDTETRRKAGAGFLSSRMREEVGKHKGSSIAGDSVANTAESHEVSSLGTTQRPSQGPAKPDFRFSPCLRASVVSMALLLPMLTGALWLAYNHNVYGNALEFANGPYSPRAIQARRWTPTWTSYPGENSARTATLYFLKVSRLNLGEGRSEYLLFALAFVALLAVLFFARRYLPWTLLWLPVIFYPACIAWGSVPVYVPQWWPFGYYNVRYGLQLLPAVAVFAGLAPEFAGKFFPRLRCPAAALLLVIAGWSYGSVWRHTPISLREAQKNGAARMDFDQRLGAELAKLPPESTIMMDCSSYSGAVQSAGIPFRRVLRESNPPEWEIALSKPAQSADYVVAIDRDPVALAVRLFPAGLQPVAQVESTDGRHAVIYRSSSASSYHASTNKSQASVLKSRQLLSAE